MIECSECNHQFDIDKFKIEMVVKEIEMREEVSSLDAILTLYRFMYPEHYPEFAGWMRRGLWKPSFLVLKPIRRTKR